MILMKFKIVINCDNDAFANNPFTETARLLRKIASEIDTEQRFWFGLGQSSCMDYNGNKVGVYFFEAGTYDLDAELELT